MVLFESLTMHAPGCDFHLLLVERSIIGHQIRLPDFIKVTSAEALNIPDFAQMAFYYNCIELNTAVKPFFIEGLMNMGYERIIYFDPDIEIYSSLDNMLSELSTSDALLTPHCCRPLPEDGHFPQVEDLIRGGQFNFGFFACRSSNRIKEIIKWWCHVLKDRCLFDPTHRYFTDQFWAAIFPSFIPATRIIHYEGYNMAYWNLAQRGLFHQDGKWVTNDGDLVFFHFSGFSAKELEIISKHTKRLDRKHTPELLKLLRLYGEKIIRNTSLYPYGAFPYSFGCYANGLNITDAERRAHLQLPPHERLKIPDPFCVSPKVILLETLKEMQLPLILSSAVSRTILSKSPPFEVSQSAIVEILMSSDSELQELPIFLAEIYRTRTDVRDVFPRQKLGFTRDFVHWFESSGRAEMSVPVNLASRGWWYRE